MPSVAENFRAWNDEWPEERGGDEWTGQADFCGQPYEEWKRSLAERFISPFAAPGRSVLEIGPGHGRWTRILGASGAKISLVDISPRCLRTCERFLGPALGRAVLGDGSSFPGIPPGSVDFAWSFDCFVHMELDVLSANLREVRRVLKVGGIAVIHHPGRWPAGLALARRLAGRLPRLATLLSMGYPRIDSGWRGWVTAGSFRRAARDAGLRVVSSHRRWGPDDRFTVAKYRDWISVLERPAPHGPGTRHP